MPVSDKMVVVANIVALLANGLMIVASSAKTKKRTLLITCAEVFVFAVSDLMLMAFSAAIVNLSCIVRNLVCYKDKMTNVFKAVYLAIIITLSLIFNKIGWVGYIPIITTIIFTIFMTTKDEIKFKILLVVIMSMWAVHDFLIMSYVSAVCDIIAVIAAAVSGIMIYRADAVSEEYSL